MLRRDDGRYGWPFPSSSVRGGDSLRQEGREILRESATCDGGQLRPPSWRCGQLARRRRSYLASERATRVREADERVHYFEACVEGFRGGRASRDKSNMG